MNINTVVKDLPSSLFEFALCRNASTGFNDHINNLKELASNENWGRDNGILKNYLSRTYEKLASDYNQEKINKNIYFSFVEDEVCFNTGLFTDNYEEIYAYFEKNQIPLTEENKDKVISDWYLLGFRKKSDTELSKFHVLPHRAQFFQDASDLVFDYRNEIRPNLDHILDDPNNFSRLPESIQKLDKVIIQNMLRGTIENAVKKVSANYKLAVPQYYKGSLQLLIPLAFSSTGKADLALTLQKNGNVYDARTCLTIEWAYNNARLIVKPESEWLKID